MPYVDILPSKALIFDHWKDRFREIGIFIDWGEPSCWACGFHYGSKYDIKSSDASMPQILDGWERMPLQRCHIVPRSLGGTDELSNLFLMCRECHDLAPNTSIPEVFFEWVRAQCYSRRDSARIEEAFRAFGIQPGQYDEIVQIMESKSFQIWSDRKTGMHRPQCGYPSRTFRLTPATMIGLAAYYRGQDHERE